MRKGLLLVALTVVSALTIVCYGAERGKFIHVDTSVNKNLKPQLAFCQDHVGDQDITTLLVQTVNVNAYNEFTDASRVLLRFADGKVMHLNRVAGSPVDKNKHSEKKGNATITFYRTVTSYEVTPEVIEELGAGNAIIKVRIVFKENESKDYDINESYRQKMSADLLKSYQAASSKSQKSHSDMSDEDF